MHKDDFNQINGYARKFGFAWFIATLFMHQKRAKAIWNQGNEKKNIVPQYVEAAKDALEKSFIRSTGSNESNVFHRCSSMVMNYPGETKYLMTVADCYGVMNVVKAYAANLSNQENTITEDELIQYGVDWAESTSQWGGDYLVRGGTLEGTGTDPLFWDKLAEFTGKEIPEDRRENFFSCSC